MLPYLIGLAFERDHFSMLGISLVAMQMVVAICVAIAWRVASGTETDDEIEEMRARLVEEPSMPPP